MPIPDLRSYVPSARRFARVLCGSQERGDAYIAQALEALVKEPRLLASYGTDRTALYATVIKLCNTLAASGQTSISSSDPIITSADRRLQAMTPRSRQAFLLIAMEGFAETEAARIMDVELDQLRAFIKRASSEILHQISTDVLIVEDEPLIAMDLEALMAEVGHRTVGIAATQDQALELAMATRPGLVLADIQLAHGASGIETVNEMLKWNSMPVVFITAFPERLLTGRRPEPTFLIPKPFKPSAVKAVTSQALFFDQKAHIGGIAA
jgi:CheY-like chemotaxis protein